MNIFYNLGSKEFSQNLATDEEAFSLSVDVSEEGDLIHMLVSICARYNTRT